MSTVNVNTIKPITDDVDLKLQAGGSTRMLLTSAGHLSGGGGTLIVSGALSGTGGSITNFTGLGKVLGVTSKSSQDTTSFSADSWVVWDADLNITVTPQSTVANSYCRIRLLQVIMLNVYLLGL